MTSYIDKVTTRFDGAARKSLERQTRLSHIIPLMILMLLSSVLGIAGVLTGGLTWLHELPRSTSLFVTGIYLFLLVVPQMLLLYACRTLFRAIRELEQRVGALEHHA
jgi:hypothetical protein